MKQPFESIRFLLLEISESEVGKSPKELIGPNEEVVGELPDDFKKFWTIIRRLDLESDEAGLKYKHSQDDDDNVRAILKNNYQCANAKSQLATAMFFYSLSEFYDTWGKYFGVRAEWILVKYDPPHMLSIMDMFKHHED
jgi:hypothetical protein